MKNISHTFCRVSLRFYYSLIYSHSCRVLERSRIKMLIFNLLSLSVPAGFLKYMKVIAILIFILDSYLNLPASFKQSFCILLLLYSVSSLRVIFFSSLVVLFLRNYW